MKLYLLLALSMLTHVLIVICDYRNHHTHISHLERQFKSPPPTFYGICKSIIPFP